jgi:hypothetical protein
MALAVASITAILHSMATVAVKAAISRRKVSKERQQDKRKKAQHEKTVHIDEF